jgi:hypothetical protein
MALLAALPAYAQYPVQTSKGSQDAPEMRAVAVLEWTGEDGHPKASRLVPVSVYDGQDLQDAGIYLAQPAPLALSSEVEYELKENGKTVGLFDVNSAGQEQGSWVGFGVWKPLAKPKPVAHAAKATSDDLWGGDVQSDRPVLHRKHGADDASGSGKDDGSGSSGQAQDPDRPTLHKKGSSDSSGDSGTSAPDSSSGSDPDQPTLHKKASSDSGDANTASSGTASSTSSTDPDRPTLHKKTSDTDSADGGNTTSADPDRPKLKKQSAKTPSDGGYVESVASSTDPNRPRLQRGKPADEASDVLPTLMGLPADMHQAVAVSDAKSRPEHLWTYSWSNPDDEAKMKADLEDLARKALGLAAPATAAKPASAARRTAASVQRKAKPAAPPVPAPLLDEQFRVFELSYGAGATMVFSAHTDGSGAQEKFVTLVAQPDLYGNVVMLLKSVTDAAHLDDTPRMRLVDAVDAIADNRGELLFELRGATQRQFVLYRVLRGQADKLFTSGPGGIVPPPKGA